MEMDFNKVVSRRGAIGLPFLLTMVLGVVVLILAILFFSGFFDDVENVTSGLPQELEFVAQGCIASANAGLRTSYCKEYKDVELLGRDQWINCQYDDLEDAIKEASNNDGFRIPNCGDKKENNLDFCIDLLKSEKFKDGILVNGEDCGGLSEIKSSVTCEELESSISDHEVRVVGTSKSDDLECESYEIDITDLVEEFSDDDVEKTNPGKACCLKSG